MWYSVVILGLILYILIRERQHEKKTRELEKAVEWQKTKYETWRGYLNKGYQIANSTRGTDIHPSYDKFE